MGVGVGEGFAEEGGDGGVVVGAGVGDGLALEAGGVVGDDEVGAAGEGGAEGVGVLLCPEPTMKSTPSFLPSMGIVPTV